MQASEKGTTRNWRLATVLRRFIATLSAGLIMACANYTTDPGLLGGLLLNTSGGASFVFTQSNGNTSVSEAGTTDSYSLSLRSQPESDVSISIVFDATQLQLGGQSTSPLTLTFTNSNWDTAQNISVTAVNDIIIEETSITSSLTHTASGGGYDSIAESLTVNITDDDVVGASVPVSTTTYSEVGGSSVTVASGEIWMWFVTFAVKTDVNQTTNSETFQAQVKVNGITDTAVEQQSNEGNHYKMMIVTGRIQTAGTHTITVEIKGTVASTTTTIKDLRITSFKLPSGSDFRYAAAETTVQTTGTWSDVVTLNFTPSSAGD